jgi:glycine/D-amino acid oxidase-like deaminating enzyme/nitrite reductase/ring-hydroxylating ferredoxin subunit
MLAATHSSYWQETAGDSTPRYDELRGDVVADVAIIGGGITGLTAARLLKEAGKRVVVVEEGRVGSGTTGFTSGHLDVTTDTPLADMISHFGEDAARRVVGATRAAVDRIERWSFEFGGCEFNRVPSYQFAESSDRLDELERQSGAARKLGLTASITQAIPLPFPCQRALRIEDQARFHALRYLNALAATVHGDGCFVFENTRASVPDEKQSGCFVETPHGSVLSADVFMATHGHFLGISQFDFRVFPYQSYVIAVRVSDAVPDALFWDMATPYHYIRRASSIDPDLLLIGGCDHKTGQGDIERDAFGDLRQYAAERFTLRGGVAYEWSGQFFQPADGLPHVGRAPGREHLYMATGFSGTGLTLGTVAGEMVASLVQGQRHSLEEVLRPGRATVLASAGELISENLNVARRFVGDRFGLETIDSLDQVPIGPGRVVRFNDRQVAVFREPSGVLHAVSAVCTHAGCIVHWNDAERTWDCPCHGGRYGVDGNAFAGPPTRDLSKDITGSSERPAQPR